MNCDERWWIVIWDLEASVAKLPVQDVTMAHTICSTYSRVAPLAVLAHHLALPQQIRNLARGWHAWRSEPCHVSNCFPMFHSCRSRRKASRSVVPWWSYLCKIHWFCRPVRFAYKYFAHTCNARYLMALYSCFCWLGPFPTISLPHQTVPHSEPYLHEPMCIDRCCVLMSLQATQMEHS